MESTPQSKTLPLGNSSQPRPSKKARKSLDFKEDPLYPQEGDKDNPIILDDDEDLAVPVAVPAVPAPAQVAPAAPAPVQAAPAAPAPPGPYPAPAQGKLSNNIKKPFGIKISELDTTDGLGQPHAGTQWVPVCITNVYTTQYNKHLVINTQSGNHKYEPSQLYLLAPKRAGLAKLALPAKPQR
eukprot:TRINITY_DN50923_c0_g1_i1.p2 TRINITY_DN50923_c0_g1~~TRINITY_DN50923_c0_g1_i1.p2  ORF type:complete len:183 (+),score=28.45 TRINITY_DN50923_c0_g1_i1:144-692(+)